MVEAYGGKVGGEMMDAGPPIPIIIPERKPGEIYTLTVAELAETAFHARERVKMLEMMNTPDDYDKRKDAFVQLAMAREAANKAEKDLENAVAG